MARFLGFDWDNNQLHVVAATTGRGGVRIDAAVVLPGDFTPKLAQAEAVGQRLREQLKAAGIAPAPVVVCVGRDRVIAKELRYPQVPRGEEAAVIRFQATKELTEAAEGVVIDYTAKGDGAHGADRTALAFAIRRDLPVFFQAVCRAAGLKLLAMTPRGYGVAGCLKRAAGTAIVPAPEAGAAVAILTAAESWADFSVVRGDGLLYTRALPGTTHLIAEVRRNLAVYNGQLPASAAARDKIHAVYVAGNGEHALLREQLQHVLTVPVHALDPFAREAQLDPSGPRGGFAAAVGLVETWARDKKVAVNFIRPKEPVKAADPQQQRNVKIAAAVLVGLLALVVGCYLLLAMKRGEVAALQATAAEHDARLVQLTPDAKHIAALKEWTAASVPWLDELYDVTARFEQRDGFRLTEFKGDLKQQAVRTSGPKKAKEKYAGALTLLGEARLPDEVMVDRLKDALNVPTPRASIEHMVTAAGTGPNAKKDIKRFTLKVDVVGQPSRKYTTRFTPPEAKSATPDTSSDEEGGRP